MHMRNQRSQKKIVTIIALALAVLMILSLFTGIIGSLLAQGRSLAQIDREIAEARGHINALEGQSAELDGQLAEVGARLQALRAQEGAYLEELHVLNEQLYLLRERITLTEEQIDIYTRMLADKEVRLEGATLREEEQLELFRRRVRAMEERGSLSYIQILLSARSFGELVTRMQDASDIMAADQRIAESLERYRIAVQVYRDELLEDQEILEQLIRQLERERIDLNREADALQVLIDEISARREANEIEFERLEADRRVVDEMILAHATTVGALNEARQEAIRELERQAAAGQHGGMGGTPARPGSGSFIWPSDASTLITSPFGPRWGTMHRGIDIGAHMGTNVLAAASGYVAFSGWSGGYGNYILIRHGNGYYTAYAHMSVNSVSAGDTVIQGQVIGLVGSTGFSTGPHIHFEIIRNGERIDPMIYF